MSMKLEAVLTRMTEGVRGEADEDAILVPVADLRVVIAALSSPPADDVREALTKRVADEVEYRVRTAVTLAMNGHEYEQHVTQGRKSVAAILAEVRPYGTVTEPSDEEVLAALNATVKQASAAPDLSFWGEETASQMRASLKAAAEVRERAEA